MRKLEKNHSYEPYSYAWSCIACHAPKYHKESKRLDSNIHFPFFLSTLWLPTYLKIQFEDFTLSNYMYQYSKRNDLNKRFSLQPASISSEISLCGNIVNANFRPGEIGEISSKRNFASVDAKFRLTQWKLASALTKFRGEISSNFRENKERKTTNFVRICFAQYCISMIEWRRLLRFPAKRTLVYACA